MALDTPIATMSQANVKYFVTFQSTQCSPDGTLHRTNTLASGTKSLLSVFEMSW